MRFRLLILLGLAALSAGAANPGANPERWVSHPDQSTLGFTATQEGAPFEGRFGKFNVGLEILRTDDDIDITRLTAVIGLASVDTDYDERDDYLVQEDWFHTELWPEARFISTAIARQGPAQYVAQGELSLRGVSRPVEVQLSMELDDNGERGKLSGTAVLRRLDFGVGQGDWSGTEWVGNDVNVRFDLAILRAFE